jgi:hypothetical protein
MFIESTEAGIALVGVTAYHGHHGSGLVVPKDEFERLVQAAKDGLLDEVDVLPPAPLDPHYVAPDVHVEV